VHGEEHDSIKTELIYVSGYISHMRNDDKTYYLACPTDTCKKKVMEESTGWRCENCNRTYSHCVPTYMLSAKIADLSDNFFVNFYRNEGTSIMGMTAEKLKDLKDEGDI
jgi:replication factor A1